MKKLKAKFGLALVTWCIQFYESYPFGMLSPDDREKLSKLWEYHDHFKKECA